MVILSPDPPVQMEGCHQGIMKDPCGANSRCHWWALVIGDHSSTQEQRQLLEIIVLDMVISRGQES